MHIEVTIKTIYGIETVYPACDKAKLFARIAGTKTMTPHALRDIAALGYQINVQHEQPRILRALQNA